MTVMNWREDFSVDIASVDKQHKKIIELINRLEDAASTHLEAKTVDAVLSELLTYTRNHFKDEETLMQKYLYPGLETHRAEHEALVNRVLEFRRKFDAGKLTDVHDLANFLMGWLEGHILGTDKKYSPYLADKGVR